MEKRLLLQQRLEAVAASLAQTPGAQALIGLGSAGPDAARLDEYSDLDFFVIVDAGAKAAFLADLGWLARIAPVAYAFQNTADGYKLLFVDGVFCEFALFEPAELTSVPFSPGRIIWKRPDVPETIARPTRPPMTPAQRDIEWLLGEALTNLYVGLSRFRRGEKLSAARFVQGYAVDRVLDLAAAVWDTAVASADPFAPERRIEQRYPQLAERLPDFVQGYERSPQSAAAILAFLEEHFSVNEAMKQAILAWR